MKSHPINTFILLLCLFIIIEAAPALATTVYYLEGTGGSYIAAVLMINEYSGVKFVAKNNSILINATCYSGNTLKPNSLRLYNGTFGTLETYAVNASNSYTADINYNLTAGSTYAVGCTLTTGTDQHWAGYINNATRLPTNLEATNWTIGFYQNGALTDNYLRVITYIGLSVDTASGGSPAVTFTAGTPATGSKYYNGTSNNLSIGITSVNIGSPTNSTIKIYNSTGILSTSQTNTTSINFTHNFQNLKPGLYYINATTMNSTATINSDTTINLTIYGIIVNISTPTISQNISRYLNITFYANTTPFVYDISQIRITLRNSDNTHNSIIIANNSPSLFYYFDTLTIEPNITSYRININASDSTGNTNNQSSELFNIIANAELNISILNGLNSSLVENVTINITENGSSTTSSAFTTTGQLSTSIKKNTTYNVTVDGLGFALTTINYTSNQSLMQSLNMSIFTNNSVRIYIYDEDTSVLITSNISVVITGTGAFETTSSTITGYLYADNLPDDTYTIKFSGTNYTLKSYTITVADRSSQVLNAYLSANSQNTIFTIMDFNTAATLEGAGFTQSRIINGSWTIITSKTSDITGRVQTSYTPGVKYQFLITLSGYDNNLFYLDPVLFSSYNIRMTKATTLTPETTPDYTGVSVTYYNNLSGTTTFFNNMTNNLVFIITSPGTGSLETYNVTVTYPNGTSKNTTSSGILATGENFIKSFFINTTNISDQVIIDYCYKSTTSFDKCFRATYGIIGAYSNSSFIKNKDITYDMGILERVLVSTIIIMMVGGLFYMLAGPIPGLTVSLLLFGYMAYIGFMSTWMILPSLFIGFIAIMANSRTR